MEISNNIESVIIDIDKLTFKKQNTINDDFIINLQPSKENGINVLTSNVPLESDNIYLKGLTSANKSVATKLNSIDANFTRIDASLVDLYLNGGGNSNNNSGGSFSGAATSIQLGSTNFSLPSAALAQPGKVLTYNGNSSDPGFIWADNGAGDSASVDFATFNSYKQGVDSSFTKVDVSFHNLNTTLDAIQDKFDTHDIKFSEIDSSINEISNNLISLETNTNNKFVVVDSSITDISNLLDVFRDTANTNFTTIIEQLATTNDKFDTTDNRFVTVNSNFDSFADEINDICNNHIKKLLDNSNSLVIGGTLYNLPTTTPTNEQILKYNSSSGLLEWGTGGGSGSSNTLTFGGTDVYLPNSVGSNEQVLKYDNINNEFVWGDGGGTSGVLSFGNDEKDLPNSLPTNISGKDHVIVYTNDTLNWKDVSFDYIESKLISIDNSFVGVDGVNETLLTFDGVLINHANRLNNTDTSFTDLSGIVRNNKIEIDNSFTDLSGSVTTLQNNISTNSTTINNLNANFANYYTKIILDLSFTDISSNIHDLSNIFYDSKNKNDISFSKIDNSLNKIDVSLVDLNAKNTERRTEIEKIDLSINDISNNLSSLDNRISSAESTNINQANAISTLNNKKINYLDTGGGTRINMPENAPLGKALVVKSDDNTQFEWANVKEITKDVDVNLLNLNIYGSTDISGNIRVVDEVIVGMENGNESIRTKGLIKTNSVKLHNITFPNNLDHAEREIDISQQEIYHDVSGINLTKTVLHDVDISGVVKPLPTNSIITPLGVTIKFL